MILKKLKAGALQMTMFIVVVIALLLAAFIILIHTHKRFKIQTDFVKETITNADYGIDYMLRHNIIKNDTVIINLNDEDYKTLKVFRDHWGIYEKVVSVSKIKHNTFKKIALLGASQPKLNRTALYVKDNNKPLVVVGNTKIEGLSFLPKQGIRTGNISGYSYYGSQLIYGASKTSTNELPKLLDETLETIKNSASITNNVTQDHFIDINISRTHQNSFFKPFQIIYSNSEINLSSVSLIGHIVVQSKTKIVLDSSSHLKDVILIAPEIDIKANTEGVFQAFASKNISVGENCSLGYPSALILKEELIEKKQSESLNKPNDSFLIKMEKSSSLKGVVGYFGNTKNYKAQIFIDDEVTITGEVYCSQNLELLGAVKGSVFTSGFIANQSGSSYQNHLYNGIVNINELPQEYIGLLFENSKKNIAKWLY